MCTFWHASLSAYLSKNPDSQSSYYFNICTNFKISQNECVTKQGEWQELHSWYHIEWAEDCIAKQRIDNKSPCIYHNYGASRLYYKTGEWQKGKKKKKLSDSIVSDESHTLCKLPWRKQQALPNVWQQKNRYINDLDVWWMRCSNHHLNLEGPGISSCQIDLQHLAYLAWEDHQDDGDNGGLWTVFVLWKAPSAPAKKRWEVWRDGKFGEMGNLERWEVWPKINK